MRRVVVTGLGMVAPTGIGVRVAWETAVAGKTAVRKITRFDTSGLPVAIAADVEGFDGSPLLGAKTARQASRFVQFSAVAADEALRDAGYEAGMMGRYCGCLIGVGIGGFGEIAQSAVVLHEHGYSRVSPLTLP